MDCFEEIWQRANHVATEVAEYDFMKPFGEIRFRPSGEEVSEAMYDVTALFSNAGRYLAGDPDEPSEEAVRSMTESFMTRARDSIRKRSLVRPGNTV